MDREDKPKWLLQLENRKQKPQLAHETGSGAHCLICKFKCPGLDLHFWRKICKNCKCKGDDHDIDDYDFPQFELLFGLNIKNKKNCSFLNNKKQLLETLFDWIPPNTTKELACDYMKALPFEKLPIKNSIGAALRRHQVKRQLPLHDIDFKACNELNEKEKKKLEEYLVKLKNNVGQGKVTKLTFIQPFYQTIMTPGNATNVQQFNPQNDLKICMHKVKKSTEFSSDVRSNALFDEKILLETLLASSTINTSNIVNSSFDEQDLTHIEEKLTNKYNTNDNQDLIVSRKLKYMSHNQSIANFKESKLNTDKIQPFENKSINFKVYNKKQLYSIRSSSECVQTELEVSSPIQLNVVHSEILNNPCFPENTINTLFSLPNPKNINKLEEKMENMAINTSKLYKCYKCKEDIHCGDTVVTIEKIKDAIWHPSCFQCSTCNELLVDLVYFAYKEKLYCGRDFAVLLEIPRCFACDELIFLREYTVAEEHNYHVNHFCCWKCDVPLAGKQYVTENNKPFCLPCFQESYAKPCNACMNIIAANQQGVTIKNFNFHATIDCFCCFICKKSLLTGQIAIKENKLICSKECITEFLHGKALN